MAMSDLKTTTEELSDGLYWRVIADARLAHELTAQLAACQRERDWFKLLAWGCDNESWSWCADEGVLVIHDDPMNWHDESQRFKCAFDADGLPIRTDELEAALLKAQPPGA